MKKFFLCSVIAISMSFVGCTKAPESYESSKIVTTYKQAQSDGYTGTLDQWVVLTTQYQQNPQQAQAVASQSGYNGSDVLLAGVAGAVAGHMIASSNNANNYSQQPAYRTPTKVVEKKTVVNNYYNETKTPQPALKPTSQVSTANPTTITNTNTVKPVATSVTPKPIVSVKPVSSVSIPLSKKAAPSIRPKSSYTSRSTKSYTVRSSSRRR